MGFNRRLFFFFFTSSSLYCCSWLSCAFSYCGRGNWRLVLSRWFNVRCAIFTDFAIDSTGNASPTGIFINYNKMRSQDHSLFSERTSRWSCTQDAKTHQNNYSVEINLLEFLTSSWKMNFIIFKRSLSLNKTKSEWFLFNYGQRFFMKLMWIMIVSNNFKCICVQCNSKLNLNANESKWKLRECFNFCRKSTISSQSGLFNFALTYRPVLFVYCTIPLPA